MTVVVFSTPLMFDFASWNDGSKKKTTKTLGGKEHIFFVRKWAQHGVSQRNVTRIVGKHYVYRRGSHARETQAAGHHG